MEQPKDHVTAVYERLLAESEDTGVVPLDALGEAIGALPISVTDIETLFVKLETAGREIVAQPGAIGAEAKLKRVVHAVRELRSQSEQRPSLAAVAAQSELSESDVLSALSLLRVMQR